MGPLKPKQNHKAIGEQSEAIIMARLLEAGYGVLTPFGDNRRYDLVIEDADNQFWRVQCKTGWMDEGKSVIKFATASSYNHTTKNKGWKNYRGQCEYFAVYCSETKGVYLVPVDLVGVTQAALRLVPTVNNQEKGVRWAKDYEL
ncbi:MAG: group I intron-associated PD-(D/E)XK endonuclease [Ktedonobacteraceae bacterium]